MKNNFRIKRDIGKVKYPGKTEFNEENQTYFLTGSGKNLWFDSDEFHFAANEYTGDFILTCSLDFVGSGVDPHRKAGLMVRVDLDGSSVYGDAAVHGDGLVSLQYRPAKGAETEEIVSPPGQPEIIQLERSGNLLIMRTAEKGCPLGEAARISLPLGNSVYAGLFIGSHNEDVSETAVFRNVRVDIPAADGVDGYATPPSSRLEVLDVRTGDRKMVYGTKENIEAPNWSHDGSFILYNKKGHIYRYDIETGKITPIETGSANKNNNDHGIAPDGKTLILSSHGSDGRSRIYTVPAEGGEAREITPEGPSYWHGVTPDGSTLAYCAERKGHYNIWIIPFEGGDEIQLTTGAFLDDGPEYTPDGKFIYFNSTRSGQMKIWRMKPEGSDLIQITHGPGNDWFPHFSPDGKKMVFLTYPDTVKPELHPHNQRVMIQIMDTENNEVQVLSCLYGGQGTLNVPSWSPDGRFIAFVSYTYGNPEE